MYETYSIPVITYKASIRTSCYDSLTSRIKVLILHFKMSFFTFRIHGDESILKSDYEGEELSAMLKHHNSLTLNLHVLLDAPLFYEEIKAVN